MLKQPLRQRQLCITDRIYDHIQLPPLVTRVLDTPVVQRLRSLHQLGSSSYVFPTASHTRFEHSIGVAYMAGRMTSYLRRAQPELGMTEEDVHCCMLAGLLHDVGHGPFSHLFEDVIAKRCHIAGFCHEAMSDRLARSVLRGTSRGGEQLVTEDQLTLILGLMHGTAPHSVPYRDVVANPRGGVDVDRVDYLTRDCVMCFGRPALDTRVNRLLFTCRLCFDEEQPSSPGEASSSGGRWQLGFERKMALSLHELFALRAKLHRSVYQHPVTRAIGHMIGDAFELAAPHFKVDGQHTLMDCVKEDDLFLQLGDWVLPAMECQRDPHLLPAQQLLQRLRRRDIYHTAFSKTLKATDTEAEEVALRTINWTEEILAAIPAAVRQSAGITAKSFVVDVISVHYGKGRRNPLEDILFFNPKKPDQRPMRLGTSSGASSQKFEEKTLFVFERESTNGEIAKACDKLLTKPEIAKLFVQHDLPFQN